MYPNDTLLNRHLSVLFVGFAWLPEEVDVLEAVKVVWSVLPLRAHPRFALSVSLGSGIGDDRHVRPWTLRSDPCF